MYYIVDTDKSFYEAATDLEPVVLRLGFMVLYVHDLGATLRSKGIEFDDECKVFELCNPRQMERALVTDMRANLALPWRISVYTEDGNTKIGLLRPLPLVAALSREAALTSAAREVEEKLVQMVDETR